MPPQPPLVLLDVDGVVNALGRPLPDVWPEWKTGLATAAGRDYVITWAPELVRRLLAWRDAGAVEVQWLTTWGHDANSSLRHLLDMPELVVAGTYGDTSGRSPGAPDVAPGSLADVTPAARDELTGRWWKFDVVRRVVAEQPGRRLVWLDDDLAGERDLREWVRAATDCLLLAPRPTTGLVPDDLDEIALWLG